MLICLYFEYKLFFQPLPLYITLRRIFITLRVVKVRAISKVQNIYKVHYLLKILSYICANSRLYMGTSYPEPVIGQGPIGHWIGQTPLQGKERISALFLEISNRDNRESYFGSLQPPRRSPLGGTFSSTACFLLHDSSLEPQPLDDAAIAISSRLQPASCNLQQATTR